jgi:hypothetical protein
MSQDDSQGLQEEDAAQMVAVSGSVEGAGLESMKDAQPEPIDGAQREMPRPVIQSSVPRVAVPASPDAVVETLRRLREDVGQISELSSEEGSIVAAFSLAFLKLMEPLTKALPVDASVLPPGLGAVEKANILPKGDLVILYRDGRMESVDLTDVENRDLLITVVSDAVPRFNALIARRRTKIENRIAFLSSVTNELQSIADSLADVG